MIPCERSASLLRLIQGIIRFLSPFVFNTKLPIDIDHILNLENRRPLKLILMAAYQR